MGLWSGEENGEWHEMKIREGERRRRGEMKMRNRGTWERGEGKR